MFRFAQHDTRRNPGMKRVGIVLLQLLVTGAGLWYVFHDQQKLDANILECGDPAAAGPLSKRGHVRALQSRLSSTRRCREVSDLSIWIDHPTELRPIFPSKNTENEPQKKRSARNNCSRNTRRYSGFIWRVRRF